ncbi:Hypothetical protein PBC10988_33790 [Planctomycetales bacterium 10988]|nr:Hypothetical protein PBC10988_33790 [Planctomycetales bacterium 10988]
MGSKRAKMIAVLLAVMMTLPGCRTLPSAAPNAPATPAAPQQVGEGGQSVTVNIPPEECCPPPSIWDFLGIPQLVGGIQGLFGALGRFINRNGNFPGAEATPPVLALADPANLESSNPAVKTAAKTKAAQDAAPQKAKAIAYLATVGCGCYPDIQEALLAGLDDCEPEIRYASAAAFYTTARINCAYCNDKNCCGENVVKKLWEVAYERDDQGCYAEPSPLVRSAARRSLKACLAKCCCAPGAYDPPADEEPEGPTEGPNEAGQLASTNAGTSTGGHFYVPGASFFRELVSQPAELDAPRGTPTPAPARMPQQQVAQPSTVQPPSRPQVVQQLPPKPQAQPSWGPAPTQAQPVVQPTPIPKVTQPIQTKPIQPPQAPPAVNPIRSTSTVEMPTEPETEPLPPVQGRRNQPMMPVSRPNGIFIPGYQGLPQPEELPSARVPDSHGPMPSSAAARRSAPQVNLGETFRARYRPQASLNGGELFGKVAQIDLSSDRVRITVDPASPPQLGNALEVFNANDDHTSHIGQVEVLGIEPGGFAVVRPLGRLRVEDLGKETQISVGTFEMLPAEAIPPQQVEIATSPEQPTTVR